MRTAKVLQAGDANHPESGVACLRILVDRPWEVGGVKGFATYVWCDPKAPAPARDTLLSWTSGDLFGHGKVLIAGRWYDKLEGDSNAA